MKTLRKTLLAILAASIFIHTLRAETTYPVVATGQAKCYDNRTEITPPDPDQPFYGQDAQHQTNVASYTLSEDGLTVRDNVTGLTWQRGPDTDANGKLNARDKLTFHKAKKIPEKLNAAKFGGFDDWRLPTIKELYSLFDARGIDPGPTQEDASAVTPFLDTNFFQFAYGDPDEGERIIDSQYASSTLYAGTRGREKLLFGVNFADGRIKGYRLKSRGREKTFFVQCVRGNPAYGRNNFQDNGDGTITDQATGLMWSQTDSGKGMDWETALAWVQERNAASHLGHNDWRLPSVKELQSIVDYTRSPESTHSAAIDPVFRSTTIQNEIGQKDFPYYWSCTTHAGRERADTAMYVAFGRAAGWMSPPGRGGRPPEQGRDLGRVGRPPRNEPPQGAAPPRKVHAGPPHFVDVHGAGSQRSDPKAGDPAEFPHGRGPQGDVIRIFNCVRLVRDN